jgi:spore maturation protein CgeB
MALSQGDRAQYGCDVCFIGAWTPKKEDLLARLRRALPDLRLKIWGRHWEKVSSTHLVSAIVGSEILGEEYAKALQAASICLGILVERQKGASCGDLITSRTFNIPACGAFMLHERNHEVLRYFKEDEEAAFFESPDELVHKVQHYLADPHARRTIARRGLERCLTSGYSLDDRMRSVDEWFRSHATEVPALQ